VSILEKLLIRYLATYLSGRECFQAFKSVGASNLDPAQLWRRTSRLEMVKPIYLPYSQSPSNEGSGEWVQRVINPPDEERIFPAICTGDQSPEELEAIGDLSKKFGGLWTVPHDSRLWLRILLPTWGSVGRPAPDKYIQTVQERSKTVAEGLQKLETIGGMFCVADFDEHQGMVEYKFKKNLTAQMAEAFFLNIKPSGPYLWPDWTEIIPIIIRNKTFEEVPNVSACAPPSWRRIV
jgi:hypothetical protein